MSTTVTLIAIEPLLTIADVCRHLRLTRSQFYAQKDRLQRLRVLVEQVPPLNARPRYLGAPIAQFLSVDGQAQQLRRTLRQVSSR